MTQAAVVTAIYDGYDTLKPTFEQNDVEVDWVCVTDNKAYAKLEHHKGWRMVYEPRPDLHPNHAAKYPKMLPWRYTDATQSVWVDASYRIVDPWFVKGSLCYASPLAQYVHPWRDCLYAEAEASHPIPKYDGQPILGQASWYRDVGMPESYGLWATGVIARAHTPEMVAFGHLWLDEIANWSFQDQISHPFVSWTQGIRPRPLPGNHLDGRWLSYEGSGRH